MSECPKECPLCGADTEVKKTTNLTLAISRIRVCKACGFVGSTTERWDMVPSEKQSA